MPLMTPMGIANAAPSPIRISVPTIAFANRCRHVEEEIETQREDALSDDEEQDESKWHERDQHRERAQARDHLRDEPANGVVLHAVFPTGAATTGGAVRTVAVRFILQMRTREPA